MMRENARSRPIHFELPDGTRWCTSYTKIHVGSSSLRNQPRFHHSRTLLLSGERAHEASFERNMKRRESLRELADRGTPFVMRAAGVAAATGTTWDGPVILPPGTWSLPAGAFAKGGGPT